MRRSRACERRLTLPGCRRTRAACPAAQGQEVFLATGPVGEAAPRLPVWQSLTMSCKDKGFMVVAVAEKAGAEHAAVDRAGQVDLLAN